MIFTIKTNESSENFKVSSLLGFRKNAKTWDLDMIFLKMGMERKFFSFVAIAANNSISIFITNERNEYIPLRTTP